MLVYPTRGTPDENAAPHQLARSHAETWHYRAAGSVAVPPDTHLHALQERTIVLCCNADTNAA